MPAAEGEGLCRATSQLFKTEDFVQRNLVGVNDQTSPKSPQAVGENGPPRKPKQDKQAPRIQSLAAKDSGEDVS